jgi:Tol biopolymer transport system component
MQLRSFISRRIVFSLTITAVGLAALSAPAWATFPGTNGRIAFSSNGAGDRDIWSINPDGSSVTNLTAGPSAPAFGLEPDWSPDGTKIAFRGGRTASAEIYTMNADGTGFTQLTSNSVKDYAPAWSPDGSMIAFASNRNDPDPTNCVNLFGCNIDIFVMPATGGSPVQVTFDSGADEYPQFSPDGSQIAYQTDVGGAFAIYTVNLATLATTKLTADSLGAGYPDWSPDGTKITFADQVFCSLTPRKDCKSNVFVMNANGSLVTQLTRKFGNNLYPTWSPQGDKIVFSHTSLGSNKPQQIYTMNADGTGRTRITRTNDDSFTPDWGSG